jgi:hypothetical protein
MLTGSELVGLAENIISGSVRSIAKATDRADRILNDRVLDVLTVEIGWVVPFSEAYNGRVEEEVNAKAIAATEGVNNLKSERYNKSVLIPSQKSPSRKKFELVRRASCMCA